MQTARVHIGRYARAVARTAPGLKTRRYAPSSTYKLHRVPLRSAALLRWKAEHAPDLGRLFCDKEPVRELRRHVFRLQVEEHRKLAARRSKRRFATNGSCRRRDANRVLWPQQRGLPLAQKRMQCVEHTLGAAASRSADLSAPVPARIRRLLLLIE